jgi:fluoride ion exporter CrcB/FEX
MQPILTQALFGAIGGLVRSLVGILKHYRTSKNPQINPSYLILTVVGSAIIGAFTAIFTPNDPKVSLAAGYLGMDIIEGILKSYLKQKSFVK